MMCPGHGLLFLLYTLLPIPFIAWFLSLIFAQEINRRPLPCYPILYLFSDFQALEAFLDR